MEYIVLIVLQIILIFLVMWMFYKVRKIHMMQYGKEERITNNIFRQLEALQGLYRDLKLEKSLPETRGWVASPDFLWEIARHTLKSKPKVMVECSSGVSTIVLARCAQLNGAGHVYSIEHEQKYANITRENLAKHGLESWATVLDAPLGTQVIDGKEWTWYSLDRLDKSLCIDLLVVDGPPEDTGPLARYPAGPLLYDRLSDQGVIYMDDSDREDETIIRNEWQKKYGLELLYASDCEKGCVKLSKSKPIEG